MEAEDRLRRSRGASMTASPTTGIDQAPVGRENCAFAACDSEAAGDRIHSCHLTWLRGRLHLSRELVINMAHAVPVGTDTPGLGPPADEPRW